MKHAQALLEWYQAHKRDLPWRASSNAYRVLVSEVMLQQTRVETVLRYYDRFLERFPNAESLAAADVDDVLPLWSGLGYYSRARRLHAAARAIIDKGEFPDNYEELLLLPGVGAYTAAAVASIAFGEHVAVLDGNVERITARCIALEEDPKTTKSRRRLLDVATNLLVRGHAGDSNQAMMELGATVCTPSSPKCPLCPLASGCRAHELGSPVSFPPRKPRRAVEKRYRLSVVVREGQNLLLVKRAADEGWMPGLFELPSIEIQKDDWLALQSETKVEPRGFAARLEDRHGGSWSIGFERASVRHGITHHAFFIEVRTAEVGFNSDQVHESRKPNAELHWISTNELNQVATTSMVSKSLAALEKTQMA